MARRDEFDRVLSITFGGVVLLFLGFGLLVYACFGEATGRALYLPYISPRSSLYLPYISPKSPLYLRRPR